MRGLLMVAAVAVLTSACAADAPCCDSRLTVTPGTRYRALISNPDGGVSTTVEFVLTSPPTYESPGAVTLTFRNGGREVSERLSAQRAY